MSIGLAFSTCESIRKIEKIQKHCPRIVLGDYNSDYDVLLRKSGKVTMEIKPLKVLAIEIFKTVNNLNPNYTEDTLTPKLHPKVRPNDIPIKHNYIRHQKPKNVRSLNVDVMCVWIFETLSVKMYANHLPEGSHVF